VIDVAAVYNKRLFKMRLLALLLLWSSALGLSAQTTTVPTKPLTLEAALERASSANLDLLLSQEEVEQAKATVGSARSALLPNITGEATQSRSQSYFKLNDQIQGSAITNSFSALLQARLAVFDYNAWSDYSNAKLGVRVAEAQLEETVQDIWQQIAQTYLLHLRNQRQLDVIEAAIQRDQTLLDQAKERVDAGVASSLDLNRAEVQLATSQFQRLEQRNAAYESELTLKRLLNLPLGQPVELVDPKLTEAQPVSYNDTEMQQILDQRASMRQARLNIERSENSLRSARGERIPDVTLSGNYGTSGDQIDDDNEVWAVQLGVSVPIWEGGRISSQALQARSELRQSQLQMQQTAQQIGVDFRLAVDQLNTAREQVQIARRRVELSRNELDLARTSFEEGVADNSELTDAQANLADAEDQLVQAEYSYNLARLNLARVRGHVQELVGR